MQTAGYCLCPSPAAGRMSRIVLHVGPEKCGSSTIQNAVMHGPDPLRQLVHAELLSPPHVLQLDAEQPAPDALAYFHALIRDARAAHPQKTLILTHEMMFKMVNVLVNLAGIAQQHADEVVVIAYVRRQSDFLLSAFGQWLFRSPERIAETAEALRRQDIDPELFWGAERHLIACVLEGWHIGRQLSGHLYIDWSQSIPERMAGLAGLHVPLSVGMLPRTGFDFPLVSDFLMRAGIDPAAAASYEKVANPAYDPYLIEGVVNAIEAGFAMPGPHEANDFLYHASALPAMAGGHDVPLMGRLKSHIDTVFEAGNTRLAARLGVPAAYFAPRERIDAATVRDDILREAALRSAEPVHLRKRNRASRAALARIAWSEFRRQR